ncbi:hypothetical protein [uncultured Polaribacter sp.]|uniref:hypothetical protein n=1 Tax=uncultured Polaribacter sp. TaxID=174711 RepID=UPI002639194B|nr:hypothetical protein [uncultured Polaribacter sp.]
MIKFITYIIIIVFSISTSLAQVKSEEILIKNDSIELSGTLTYASEKLPLIISIPDTRIVNL